MFKELSGFLRSRNVQDGEWFSTTQFVSTPEKERNAEGRLTSEYWERRAGFRKVQSSLNADLRALLGLGFTESREVKRNLRLHRFLPNQLEEFFRRVEVPDKRGEP